MTERREFRDLVDPEVAREAIGGLDLEPDAEEVPLADARGRVLAERIDAALDVPGFDRASMDGYAVRARDTFGADEAEPAVLSLAGAVHAGDEPDVEVGEGEAAEISTGAVLPPGADAVVMVERTDRVEPRSTERASDGGVEIRTAVAPGDHVMVAGADIAAGQRALGPGTVLTPREIGLLSALGVDSMPVRGRPTVGIVSTGDELVRPGGDLHSAAGQIYDVNSYTIATAVEEAGGEPRLYPHAGDDYAEMERLLVEAAGECDLVLSSGSTSASAVDVIYRVVEERGDLLVHGVAVKPGKPMLIGRIGDSAYVGLPGYPVSALTIFRAFVAPAIRTGAGLPEPQTASVEATMATDERYAEGRLRLMPVGLVSEASHASESASGERTRGATQGSTSEAGAGTGGTRERRDPRAGELLVYPVDKGSGATTSLVEADGIVAVDPDTDYLARGERVTVELFSPDVRPPTLLGVGEDDPVLSALLDRIERPRYLAVGSREGERRLRDGVPDVAVTAAPEGMRRDLDAVELGGWRREWGLVVPAGDPEGVAGLSDLVERDLRLVNRSADSSTRMHLDEALEALAGERGSTRSDLAAAIDGYGWTVKAHESPARAVLAGEADVGLGLRATAEKLGLDFVALGEERVTVLANPDRTGKASVEALARALDADLGTVVDGRTGFGP